MSDEIKAFEVKKDEHWRQAEDYCCKILPCELLGGQGVYLYQFICSNCDFDIVLHIKRGIRIEQIKESQPIIVCENCGCAVEDLDHKGFWG